MRFSYDEDEDILFVSVEIDGESEDADFDIAVQNGKVTLSIGNAQKFISKARQVLSKISEQKSDGLIWHDAESSMISAYAYDEEEQKLIVAFNRTGVYTYFDVPADVVDRLHRASSKGSYMRHSIINWYADMKGR